MSELRSQAEQLLAVREQIKRAKDAESSLRNYFLKRFRDEVIDLPYKSIKLPLSEHTLEDYVASHFPTWDLISAVQEDDGYGIILRKKSEFQGYVYEDEDIKVAKVISEPTPKVDWDSLEADQPGLRDKISTKIIETRYELNMDKLTAAQDEIPEVLSILERNLLPGLPTLQIRVSKKKKDEDE